MKRWIPWALGVLFAAGLALALPTTRAVNTGAAAASPRTGRLVQWARGPGSIAQFQIYPYFTTAFLSYLTGGSEAIGAEDVALVSNDTGSTITVNVSIRYTSDVNLTVTMRKFSGGAWATAGTFTALSAANYATGTISLATTEAAGLHVAPAGGVAGLTGHWAVYLN